MPTHLCNQWFFSNSPVAKSHGTAIAFHKSCPFQLSESCLDPQGRYVFAKEVIAGQKLTFATLYVPNAQQLSFLDTVLEKLADFPEGLLILGGGGDFNVSPEPPSSSHGYPVHSIAAEQLPY